MDEELCEEVRMCKAIVERVTVGGVVVPASFGRKSVGDFYLSAGIILLALRGLFRVVGAVSVD